MKLSHATVDAQHALAYLAKQKDSRLAPAQETATACKTSAKFLSEVLKPLGDSGVVQSQKVPYGGCRLVKKPGDISLLKVVKALEGPLRRPIVIQGKEAGVLGNRLQAISDQAPEAVRRQLQKVRLADLVGKG